jgi:hypothetical protein
MTPAGRPKLKTRGSPNFERPNETTVSTRAVPSAVQKEKLRVHNFATQSSTAPTGACVVSDIGDAFSSGVDCSVEITHAMRIRLQPVGGEAAFGNLLVGTNKRGLGHINGGEIAGRIDNACGVGLPHATINSDIVAPNSATQAAVW